MNTQKLLNAPPKKPKIIAKISKVNNLVEESDKIKKSSVKLRKLFEKGTYQKKTQLSVLNRYKKRLDAINKDNDKNLSKRKNQRGKDFVPKIKPFVGSLFSSKSDPLKSLAQLAAFNTARKLAKGDILGTVGPGLALASILFGPKLLRMGLTSGLKSIGVGRGYEDLLKTLSKKTNLTKGEDAALKNFDRYRKAGLSAEEAAQKALSRSGGFSIKTASEFRKLERSGAGGNIRESIAGERSARATERAGARAAEAGGEGALKSLGKGLSGKAGLLDVVFAGFDFMNRKSEGQTNLQAGVGAGGAAIGGLVGWEAGAAVGAAIGAAFGGVGAVPGAIIGGLIASFAGASFGGGIADFLTGANKKQGGFYGGVGASKFSDVLDRYEKVIDKFSTLRSFSSPLRSFSSPGSDPNQPLSPTPSGIVNPVPSQNIGKNQGGYDADTGLDILSPVGSAVVSPVSGTLEYAEKGHVLQMGQDANPNIPGMQDQHSVRIKLDKPFSYNGKEVRFFYATHMHDLEKSIKNKSGVKINAGQTLGYSGVANKVAHVHVGFVEDREQTKYLNYKEVKSLLSGTPSTPSPRQRSIDSYTSYSPSSYGKGEVIPLPIPQQMQQMMQGGGSESMMIPGLSEQDLLNSFYKRVLLNTV